MNRKTAIAELRKLSRIYEALRHTTDILSEADKAGNQIESLRAEIEKHRKSRDEVRQELEALSEGVKDARKQATQQIREAQEELAKVKSENTIALNQERGKYNAETAKLRERLKVAEKETNERIAELDRRRQDAETKYHEAEKALQDMKARIGGV